MKHKVIPFLNDVVNNSKLYKDSEQIEWFHSDSNKVPASKDRLQFHLLRIINKYIILVTRKGRVQSILSKTFSDLDKAKLNFDDIKNIETIITIDNNTFRTWEIDEDFFEIWLGEAISDGKVFY